MRLKVVLLVRGLDLQKSLQRYNRLFGEKEQIRIPIDLKN